MKPLLKKMPESSFGPELLFVAGLVQSNISHVLHFTAFFVMHTHIKVLLMNDQSPLYS